VQRQRTEAILQLHHICNCPTLLPAAVFQLSDRIKTSTTEQPSTAYAHPPPNENENYFEINSTHLL
jgi:hypothetical protein